MSAPIVLLCETSVPFDFPSYGYYHHWCLCYCLFYYLFCPFIYIHIFYMLWFTRRKAAGFEQAIQAYAIHVLSLTYQKVPRTVLAEVCFVF